MNAKSALFHRVLGQLKEQRPYFRLEEIQTLASDEELTLKDSSLKVYLSETVRQALIHDAGRGWYSRLGEPAPLDPRPVAKLIRAVTGKIAVPTRPASGKTGAQYEN